MKKAIRLAGSTIVVLLLALLTSGFTGAAPAAHAFQSKIDAPSNSFLASDDYKDKSEIKNVFLKDADYAKMTEDFKFNGSDEFDWGWAAPGFDMHKYKTARLVVKDDFGVLDPDFIKYVRTLFESVAKRLGLRIVAAGAPADVELGFDVVDYDSESHYAFVTMVQPQVELEVRVRDLKTGQDVFLVRNEEHDATPKAAVTETAQDLLHAWH